MNTRASRGARAGAIGAALGLVPAAGLGLLSFFNSDGPPALKLLAALPLALVYASPYLVVLMACRIRSPGARGGLLAPIGLLSLVASFSSMSLVTVVFLPATVFIWVAAARSLAASAARPLAAVLPAAAGGTIVAAAIVSGFFTLLLLQEDETQCWVLASDQDGQLRWAERPNIGGPGRLSIGLIEDLSIIRSFCTSDVITLTEAAMSIGILAVALLGGGLLSRLRWPGLPAGQTWVGHH